MFFMLTSQAQVHLTEGDDTSVLLVAGKDGFDQYEGLALDLSRMRFARVKSEADIDSSERTVVYLGEACLRDVATIQYLATRPVTVTAQDVPIGRNLEERITVEPDWKENIETIVNNGRADERGCIQFTYELSHKLYDVQKYFLKKLTFKVGDQEKSKYVALNPWEHGFLTYQEFTQAYENWSDARMSYEECEGADCPNLDALTDVLKEAEDNLVSPLFSENLEPFTSPGL